MENINAIPGTTVAPYMLLQHTFPFVMLDSAYELEPGRTGKGEKLITGNEFLGRGGTFPAVLLIEAAAQLSGIVSGRRQGGVLAGLKEITFFRAVHSGDLVEFVSTLLGTFGGLYRFTVEARSGGEKVMEGEIYLALA